MDVLNSFWILTTVFNFVNINAVKVESSCPDIVIPNGTVRISSEGRLANFRCKRNYKLVGVSFAVCLSSGQWSQKIPTCVGTNCKKPDEQTSIIVEQLYDGGVRKYSCPVGFTRSGPERLLCVGKKWNGTPAKCVESTPQGCDFESEDLCGWSQDSTDDFDWIRIKGETPTANTGPEYDHTTNSSDGHYLFMESSAPQKFGQTTRIISPPYMPDQTKNMCLEFFYHMLGPDGADEVGELDVYVKPYNVSISQIRKATLIFHIGENQGDKWNRAAAVIPQQLIPFNVVIQATKRNSWTGDISIDDVKLYNCSERTTITTVPSTGHLTEDSGASSKDGFSATQAPKRTANRPLVTQRMSTSIATRKPQQTTTPKLLVSSLTSAKRTRVTTASAWTPSNTTIETKLSKATLVIPSTISSSPSNAISNNNVNTEVASSKFNTQQWTSSINSMTTHLSSVAPNIKTNDNSENNPKVDYNEGNSNTDNNKNISKNKLDDNKGVVKPPDTVDYIDPISNIGRNRSSSNNDSQTPYFDYGYNSIDANDGTFPSSDDDSALDGLLTDTGSVKDRPTSPGPITMLPLILGIVGSLLVGLTVIVLLIWMRARSQRQKEEKNNDDQMNIITEYVETNLSV